MAANQWGWCKSDSTQVYCYERHVRAALEPGPGKGRNLRCPLCGGNMSVTKADIPNQWVVITCHGDGCDRLAIRGELVSPRIGIDARCLGLAGLEQVGKRSDVTDGSDRMASGSTPSARAAIQRSYVHAKLARADTDNATLLKLAIWLVSKSDGNLPGDFGAILPGTQPELASALRDFGIENSHACKLARNYFRSKAA